MTENMEKKEAAVYACLNEFVKKGLYNTTSRDLSKAMNLQSGGLYYYFSSKDEAVIVCAEEASFLLENEMIVVALSDIENPQKLIDNLQKRAIKYAPVMKFLVQVCSSNQYKDAMRPALDRLSERYAEYAMLFSARLGCDVSEIEPYVYMCITAVTNYMVFEEPLYVVPQLEMMKNKLIELQNKQNATNKERIKSDG